LVIAGSIEKTIVWVIIAGSICPFVGVGSTGPKGRLGELPGILCRHCAQHRFDLDRDRDRVAQCESVGAGDRSVEGDAKIVTVDLGGRTEASAGSPKGIGNEAIRLNLQGGGLGNAVDSHLAIDQVVAVNGSDSGEAEGDSGEVVGVQESGRLDVGIAVLIARVEGSSVDGHLD
jgi:uncharacterized protein YidB (DUF937 family)